MPSPPCLPRPFPPPPRPRRRDAPHHTLRQFDGFHFGWPSDGHRSVLLDVWPLRGDDTVQFFTARYNPLLRCPINTAINATIALSLASLLVFAPSDRISLEQIYSSLARYERNEGISPCGGKNGLKNGGSVKCAKV